MRVKTEVVFTLLVVSLSASPVHQAQAGVSKDDLQLELASVVFRHGDRSPLHTFPNDSYGVSDWPQGYGQLSRVGMQQQYRLGELLRARYVVGEDCTGLICANYTRAQVRVQSTDVERTLMSVQTQLAALYPSSPNQIFRDSLVWQPIPVHTVPVEEDKLLRVAPSCPAFSRLVEKNKDLPEYQKMEVEYKDFLDDIGKKSGVRNLSLVNVHSLADTLFIETVSDGYKPPIWANDSVMATMVFLSDFTMTLVFNTKEKNRLTAGMWLKKVLFDMKNKANPNGNRKVENMKLLLYSAHDTTVAAMTSALQVFNSKQPGYATAFAVELYSDSSKNFFVKMFHRNGPDSETFDLLNVTYCKQSGLCTLQEFESFVTPLIPDDLATECMLPTQSPDLQSLMIISITLGCILSLIPIVAIIMAVVSIALYLWKKESAEEPSQFLLEEFSA